MIRHAATLAALLLTLCGQARPVHAQGADWSVDRGAGVHVTILDSYRLPAGARAREPIVVIGGVATIDGTADDDVVVIGGTLRVGPTAVISGDVTSIGGEAIIDPAARIAGPVDRTAVSLPDIEWALADFRNVWWPAFAFGATLLRFALVLVIAALLMAIAPGWMRGIEGQVSASPLASAGIGLATQILFVPAILAVAMALIVSIVGIPLLLAFPFVLGGGALLWVAGFTAVAMRVGARLRGTPAGERGFGDAVLGFAVIWALTLGAHLLAVLTGDVGIAGWSMRAAGRLIEYVAWTVGLGAGLAGVWRGRSAPAPPPRPYAPAARPA